MLATGDLNTIQNFLARYPTRPVGIDRFGKPAYITCKQTPDGNIVVKLPYVETQDFVKIKDKVKQLGFRYNPEDKSWLGNSSQYVRLANDIFDYLPASERVLAYQLGCNHRIIQIVKQKIADRETVSQKIEEISSDIATQISKDIEFIKQNIPTLYEYQIRSVSRILKSYYEGKNGFILNDAPGLGKTVQAISFLMAVYHKNMNVAFFTTNAMLPIIVDEFYKFDKSKLLVNRLSNVPQQGGRICIMPYSILTAKNKVTQLLSVNFDVIILDEVQNLKNIHSKRVKIFEHVYKKSRFVLAMTGTLFKNRPLEAYNVLRYTRIINEKTRVIDFVRHFEGDVSAFFYSKKGAYKYYYSIQSQAVAKLRNFLEQTGQYIRRMKEDVINELPAKKRVIVPVELAGNVDLKQIIQNESEIIQKLEARYKLTPEEAQRLSTYRRLLGMEKAPAIVDYILENLSDRDRLIIFAHHKDVIDKIHSELSNALPDHLVMKVHGETTPKQRDEYVVAFQGNAERAILVLSLSVMSEGVTLTKANEIVFAEIDWVPATILQAEDRIHRISQKAKTCFYYYMIAPNTIDQYVYNVIKHKNIYIESFEV